MSLTNYRSNQRSNNDWSRAAYEAGKYAWRNRDSFKRAGKQLYSKFAGGSRGYSLRGKTSTMDFNPIRTNYDSGKVSQGNDYSKSSTKIVKKSAVEPKLFWSIPLSTFLQTFSQQFSTAFGKASVAFVSGLTVPDLQNLQYFAMNQIYNNFVPGNSVNNSMQNTYNSSIFNVGRLLVKGFVREDKLINESTIAVEVVAYELEQRFNSTSGTTPSAVWVNGQAAQNFVVANTGATLFYDSGRGTVAPLTITAAGSYDVYGGGRDPFQCSLFRESYTLVKKTKIVLHPGAVHVHKVKHDLMFSMSPNEINNLSGTNIVYVGRKSRHTLYVYNGIPVKDLTNNQVTLGQCEIGILSTLTYKYKFNPFNSMAVNATSIASGTASATCINPQTDDPDTDVVL